MKLKVILGALVVLASMQGILASTPSSADGVLLESTIVTSTRESKAKSELSESVQALTQVELEHISPTHPAEALNRIPGVHINNLGGEGHMSSIRQPITTSGVYLFLEDGIPTRPTGFFNHNGLYEINIPQSSRVEVIKGPGSALYGSDAIGGVINVITKSAPDHTAFDLNLESGSDGWQRGLASTGTSIVDGTNLLLEYNRTESEGFREAAEYDRNSLTARLDSEINEDMTFKFLATKSEINQSGVSSLEEDDYRFDTQQNFYHSDIGFREVDAVRLSTELAYQTNNEGLLSVTTYYRNNEMKMMPSWMVTYDPNIRSYDFESYGSLIKFRQKILDDKGEIIVGFDYDMTPSSYEEQKITTERNEAREYIDYAIVEGDPNYLFDAKQTNRSPYLHTEFQLSDKWRINAGVRYDEFKVDYDNFLSALSEGSHIRPESQTLSYENTSPKFGAIYQYSAMHQFYLNHRHAFRAPTVGALFRPGSSQNSTELEPVTSVSSEVGFRGQFEQGLQYEIAIYDMKVEDDIVSIIDGSSRKIVNAGETSHQGIELGFDAKFNEVLALGLSYTYTNQEYKNFSAVQFDRSCFCNRELNFAGNEVSKAPKDLANLRLAYTPTALPGFRAELELQKIGAYYTDQTNTQEYDGHELFNLRMSYKINKDLSGYLNILNLSDELYSSYTSNQVSLDSAVLAPISYRPGRPRSAFAGVRYSF